MIKEVDFTDILEFLTFLNSSIYVFKYPVNVLTINIYSCEQKVER